VGRRRNKLASCATVACNSELSTWASKRQSPRRNFRHQSEFPVHRITDHTQTHTHTHTHTHTLVDCQRPLQLSKPGDGYDQAAAGRCGDSSIVDPSARRAPTRLASSPVCRCRANDEIAFRRRRAEENATSDRNWVAVASSRIRPTTIRRELSSPALIGKVSTAASGTADSWVVFAHRQPVSTRLYSRAASASIDARDWLRRDYSHCKRDYMFCSNTVCWQTEQWATKRWRKSSCSVNVTEDIVLWVTLISNSNNNNIGTRLTGGYFILYTGWSKKRNPVFNFAIMSVNVHRF